MNRPDRKAVAIGPGGRRGPGAVATRLSGGVAVIAAALTDPQSLGLPHPCWTLDRLQDYLNGKGIGIRRSRIDEVLIAEGLRWREHETWFGERVDPDFAAKN